jgi:hypothetical protein
MPALPAYHVCLLLILLSVVPGSLTGVAGVCGRRSRGSWSLLLQKRGGSFVPGPPNGGNSSSSSSPPTPAGGDEALQKDIEALNRTMESLCYKPLVACKTWTEAVELVKEHGTEWMGKDSSARTLEAVENFFDVMLRLRREQQKSLWSGSRCG